MKLATFSVPGSDGQQAGEIRDHEVHAFDDGSTVLDRLASGDRSPAGGAVHALADVQLLAPVPRPRAIFGVGLNYRAHATETGREPPERPILFQKPPSSAVGPAGPVVCPAVVQRLDYEGELGVVMGAGGAVAGYVVCDDVTARDLQKSEPQWTRAKGFDTACPYGPWITTVDEVSEPGDLRLQTWVNGEPRQDARTSDLIFPVPALVAFIGEVITLEPGDLILTGTPGGVGMAMSPRRFLQPGDVVRVEIETLGAIEHAVA